MRTLINWFRDWAARLTRRESQAHSVDVEPDHAGADVGEAVEDRLRRLCRQCVTGQVAAAELELYDWQRHEQCPTAGRVLLAALLARRDRCEDALAVLPRPGQLETDNDALAAETLVSLLVGAGLNDTAARVVRQIHDDLGQKADVVEWLRLMQMPGSDELPPLSEATVDHLAAELLCRPEVIASLVRAQQIEPDAAAVALLRQALGRMALHVFDQERKLMICQAMSTLSQLAEDRDDARRWARHGLQFNPYSAPLALTLSQVSEDPASEADAAEALQRACAAHPDYPDLRRALILCEHEQGNTHAARLQLTQWLERQPGHPMATKLAEELAA